MSIHVPPSDRPTLFYRFCRFLCFVCFKFIWRLKIYHVERIPSHGAVIIAPNHRSFADPPLVGVSIERPLHFLAKKELYVFKPFGLVLRNLNAHPLNRSRDVGAFKMSQRLLEHGHTLILFPEGRRSKTDDFQPAKAGVGMLSMLTGTPVVPAYVHNSGFMKKLLPVSVHFGHPLRPEDFKTYQEMADAVMGEIQKIKDQVAGNMISSRPSKHT